MTELPRDATTDTTVLDALGLAGGPGRHLGGEPGGDELGGGEPGDGEPGDREPGGDSGEPDSDEPGGYGEPGYGELGGHGEILDGDLAAALARAAPRRWWNRGTLVLGGCALVLAGFLGGVLVQQHWGATTAATASTARTGGFAGFAGAGGRGTGAFGGGAAPGASAAPAATTGTVKLVDGGTIYVQTPGGDVVTVRTTGKTSVRTATKASLSQVKAGQTVTIQGATGADGTVTATSVTTTAK